MKTGIYTVVLGMALAGSFPAYSSNTAAVSLPDKIELPEGGKPVAVKIKEINGESYTFVKYLRKKSGEVLSLAFDPAGKEIDEKKIPLVEKPPLISPLLKTMLGKLESSGNDKNESRIKNQESRIKNQV